MEQYSKPVQIRWSDIDANNHLRHSAYYDFGAFLRIQFMAEKGIDMKWMQENHIGPIIFREECVFKRELHMADEVHINVQAIRATPGFDRWTLCHELIKSDGTVAAIITLDGAWMDTQKRKLAIPPDNLRLVFDSFPKSKEFEWVVKQPK
jgi:acyl-CoA thioester hydrolase